MTKVCGKCEGSMSIGVVVDHGYGTNYPERWQRGEAKMSWFGSLKESRKAQLDVETWRCDQCGYLESYAPTSSHSETAG